MRLINLESLNLKTKKNKKHIIGIEDILEKPNKNVAPSNLAE